MLICISLRECCDYSICTSLRECLFIVLYGNAMITVSVSHYGNAMTAVFVAHYGNAVTTVFVSHYGNAVTTVFVSHNPTGLMTSSNSCSLSERKSAVLVSTFWVHSHSLPRPPPLCPLSGFIPIHFPDHLHCVHFLGSFPFTSQTSSIVKRRVCPEDTSLSAVSCAAYW